MGWGGGILVGACNLNAVPGSTPHAPGSAEMEPERILETFRYFAKDMIKTVTLKKANGMFKKAAARLVRQPRHHFLGRFWGRCGMLPQPAPPPTHPRAV